MKGRKPGIYAEWFGPEGAEIQINGFPGAIYKGFTSREEARAWIEKLTGGGRSAKRDGPHREKPTVAPEAQHIDLIEEGKVIIYTDGGCIRNPGPGGYGAVLICGEKRTELLGGYKKTTNNRMELTACIKALEGVPRGSSAVIYSDSQYVVKGIEKGWAKRWRAHSWKRNEVDKAENADLWARLLELCENNDVKFVWLRGHTGVKENERCDRLSYEMACQEDLPRDEGFGDR